MGDAMHADEPEHEDDGDGVIERRDVIELEQTEHLAARHAGEAVLRMREGQLQRQEIDHLGERQRDHRELQPLPADRQIAEAGTEPGRDERPRRSTPRNGAPIPLPHGPRHRQPCRNRRHGRRRADGTSRTPDRTRRRKARSTGLREQQADRRIAARPASERAEDRGPRGFSPGARRAWR